MRISVRYLLIAIIASLLSLSLPGSNAHSSGNKVTTNVSSAPAVFDDPVADLGVTKSGPDTATAGSNITYTITVMNSGPDNADTATLSDPLPANTTFVSLSSPGGWSCLPPLAVGGTGTVNCSNPSLGVTSGDVFTLVLKIDPSAPPDTFISNQASVSTTTFDPNDENNSSTASTLVPGTSADLGVTKSANVAQVVPGSNITYTITVRNGGPDAAATVTLSDPLPATMTFVSLSKPAGWTCSTPGAGTNGTVSCAKPSVAVTSGDIFTLVGQVPSGAGDGDVFENTVTISSTTDDPNAEDNSATASTTAVICFTNSIVTTNLDSGAGSLRQAIADTCADGTITFDMNQVTSPITLTSAGLAVNKNLTIQGPGANLLTVTRDGAAPRFRIFTTNAAAVAISGLTISNGLTANGADGTTGGNGVDGGGIHNSGTLNLTGVAMSGNRTGNGGNASASGNQGGAGGCGGAIYNQGTLTMITATVSGNQAGDGGNSIDQGVSAGGAGGGFCNQGTLTLTNSTISGNQTGAGTAGGNGGGIFSNGGANNLTLTGCTITGNTTAGGGNGGGVFESGGTATASNTILAGNSTGNLGPDVFGTIHSNGYNLVQSVSSATIVEDQNAGTVIVGQDPLLHPLANNGGPMQTHSFQCASPAIDKGKNFARDLSNSPILTDQRGFDRPFNFPDSMIANAAGGDGSDIGAYEAQASDCIPTATAPSPAPSTNEDTLVVITLKGSNPENSALTFTITQQPAHGSALSPSGTSCTGTTPNNCTATVSYTPSANYFGPDLFKFKVSAGGIDSADAVVNLTVAAVADTPSVTPASTNQNTQTTSGLVISRNPGDGAEVTNFKITNITNGTLFQNDGMTPILNGTFITVAQGALGLKFTPGAGLSSPSSAFSFNVQASLSNADGGLGGGLATAAITVHPPTSTAVTTSGSPSDFGQNVIFTATVTSNGGVPTGTVQFKDNGSNLGSAQTLNGSGVATVATAGLTVGTHTITADYSGDANFLASTGTLVNGQVVKARPSLTINDVSLTEGDSGTKNAVFTLTLSAASSLTVTVNYATADGTATAPGDYTAIPTTQLVFNPGETSKTISVSINGDQSFEPDETFFVNLSGAFNVTIADNQGQGTILNDDARGGIISFSSGAYTVAENGRFATITINRTGDTSGAATVDYATSDDSDPSKMVSCAVVNGVASSRCDFTTAAGTLKFAAGETSKTFKVLITQDSYVEGSETFPITLANLTGGAVFGAPSITTVTITDDVPEQVTNPIDDPDNFVRQHYYDFLNREADPGGLAFWTSRITDCGNDAACIRRQRIGVSAEFFIEQEFQQTGFYVYRVFKGALGRQPSYLEFITDRSELQANPNLDAEKVTYTADFVERGEFIGKYAAATTATAFVDALIQNVQTNSGVDLTPRRNELLAAYNGGSNQDDSRARTLRALADHADFMAAEFNRGFVLAQYFSYLRRDPDPGGFSFWLNVLNNNPNNFRVMVCNFITSDEYQGRFGALHTHSNSECAGSPIAAEGP